MTANLQSLFYDDYFGVKWQVSENTVRTITWSSVNDSLVLPSGEFVSASTSLDDFLGDIRKAFQVWDDAIESIAFAETNSGNAADVTIAATDIDGIGGLYGYWNSIWDANNNITEGAIQFDAVDLNNGWLLTTAMHEIGNILGLGDLPESSQYKSVQEDPFPEYFIGNQLWEYDADLIGQIYPTVSVVPEPLPENPAFEPTPAPVSEPEQESDDGIIESVVGKGKLKGTGAADAFVFDVFDAFTKKNADKVIGFNPSQGDFIAVGSNAFTALQGASEVFFASANSKKQLKDLSRQGYDFVYFEKKGRLYFDGNGAAKNWGDPSEGGLVATFKGKPELAVDDFVLLA